MEFELEDEFIQAICAGDYDDELQHILDAVKHRKIELGQSIVPAMEYSGDGNDFLSVREGDVVKFNQEISPRYLVGRTAPVIKVNHKSVKVQMPTDPALRRFSGQRVRVPRTLIEGKVEAHA